MVDEYRQLFDAMASAAQVAAWFRTEEDAFFQEWPRGGGPLSAAINAAESCRFSVELGEYAARLDTYWDKPEGPNPFRQGRD